MAYRVPLIPKILLSQLRQAVTGSNGEASWPAQAPTAVDVGNAAMELDAAMTTLQQLEAQVAIAREAVHEKIGIGRALMQKIDNFTSALYGKTDARKSSFGLAPISINRRRVTKRDLLDATINILSIADGTAPSSIFIDWSSIDGAASYEIEWFTDSALTPASRVGNLVLTQSRMTIEGLTSGVQYWVRVRAVRANQHTPWSDPGTRVAGL